MPNMTLSSSHSLSSKARPKQQLSCGNCRARKSKCDRQHPCSRSIAKYRSKTNRIEDRIGSLEQKLQSLISTAGPSSSGDTPTVPIADGLVESPAPRLHINGLQTQFIDSSHWEGIMDDIHGLRQDLQKHEETAWTSESDRSQQSASRSTASQSPYLLFGAAENVELDELLHPLIPKSLIDNLLDFLLEQNRIAALLIVLHIPTFRATLDQVYQTGAEQKTDLAFMASLYAVVSMACHTAAWSDVAFGDAPLDRLAHTCMRRAAQCLRYSDYVNHPNKWTTGSMILYLGAEHPFARGPAGAIAVLSLAVGIAVRLGYHRDPAQYKNEMPVFEVEMRRRTWCFLTQLDHLTSVKSGSPKLIDERMADTALPQNLLDKHLFPAMTTLPPSMSPDDPSPISLLNHKSALLSVLGSINNQKNSASYEAIQALDAGLSVVADRRPNWLTVTAGLENSCALIFLSAVEVDLIEQSARMMLHRKYLLAAHSEQRYHESRTLCLKSAERALYLQTLVAQHQRENWRFIALVGHDFMTAAMLLCLDVSHAVRMNNKVVNWSERRRRIGMLAQARDIWSAFGMYDSSGSQAAEILSLLLQRFDAAALSDVVHDLDHAGTEQQDGETSSLSALTAGMSCQDMPSTFDSNEEALQFQSMLDMSNVEIDWSAWSNNFTASGTGLDLDIW